MAVLVALALGVAVLVGAREVVRTSDDPKTALLARATMTAAAVFVCLLLAAGLLAIVLVL